MFLAALLGGSVAAQTIGWGANFTTNFTNFYSSVVDKEESKKLQENYDYYTAAAGSFMFAEFFDPRVIALETSLGVMMGYSQLFKDAGDDPSRTFFGDYISANLGIFAKRRFDRVFLLAGVEGQLFLCQNVAVDIGVLIGDAMSDGKGIRERQKRVYESYRQYTQLWFKIGAEWDFRKFSFDVLYGIRINNKNELDMFEWDKASGQNNFTLIVGQGFNIRAKWVIKK